MTEEQLKQIPIASPTDNLGVLFLEDDEPITVTDNEGNVWSFAKNLDTGEKVRVQEFLMEQK